jgi:hypothetical protein
MERDYVQEMRAMIDQEACGEYVSGIVAAQIVEKLRVNDPDLLIGWLGAQAVALVHQAINERDRSRRTHARTAGPRSVFAQAAEKHERGEVAPLYRLLDTHYSVNSENLRKPLASMNGGDLEYVSGSYQARASDAAMEAAFFAALARKVGDDTVAEHFTEDQIREMRASLRG